MIERQVHIVTVIRQWVLALGGAGLLCGLAQCLTPSKAMEKQLRLVLSLVLLCLLFGIFGKISIDGAQAFTLGEENILPGAQQDVTQQGVLMLTRLELAKLIEQTLEEQTGLSFTVSGIALTGEGEEIAVSEVSLLSLNGITPQEVAQILNRQLALSVTVSEVNQE